MECKLIQTVELPTHGLFIGEIVAAYSEDRFLTYGKPDARNANPILLTLPDKRYWGLCEQVGLAWEKGLKYQFE